MMTLIPKDKAGCSYLFFDEFNVVTYYVQYGLLMLDSIKSMIVDQSVIQGIDSPMGMTHNSYEAHFDFDFCQNRETGVNPSPCYSEESILLIRLTDDLELVALLCQ
jgi:hypothetical protein